MWAGGYEDWRSLLPGFRRTLFPIGFGAIGRYERSISGSPRLERSDRTRSESGAKLALLGGSYERGVLVLAWLWPK